MEAKIVTVCAALSRFAHDRARSTSRLGIEKIMRKKGLRSRFSDSEGHTSIVRMLALVGKPVIVFKRL